MASRVSSLADVAIRSAIATALCLPGGLAAGFGAGAAVFEGLPGHMPEGVKGALAASLAFVLVAGGGALWGRVMATTIGSRAGWHMTWAGALGFGLSALGAGGALGGLAAVVERPGGPGLPIHVVYALLFTPATSLVAAIGGFALDAANGGGRSSAWTATGGGLAAGAAFLAVALFMDMLGFRVGAPGAAERSTMITVTFVGSVAAALAGGAVVGTSLRSRAAAARPPTGG